MSFEDASGERQVRRVPLLDKDKRPVTTVVGAKEELERLRTKRADESLLVLGRTPKFTDYADHYIESIMSGEGMKKRGTIEKEESHHHDADGGPGGLRFLQESIRLPHSSCGCRK